MRNALKKRTRSGRVCRLTGFDLYTFRNLRMMAKTVCNADEWQAYNHIIREHKTVCYAKDEWARDDDGDGIREVHTNTIEGMWTDVRNLATVHFEISE